MGMAENMGGNMLPWNINLPQQLINILHVVGHTRICGEYIAPVLVIATKAISPAAPMFLSLIVRNEPFQDLNGPFV